MKKFFLTTERLGFSTWSEADLPEALALWGNHKVTEFITADGKMTEEQVKERLKKEMEIYKNYNMQYWPIYMKETCENIGCCGLRPYDIENKILEMGVHLKDSYWGSGFAKEACLAVKKYAFDNMGADAIFAGHNPKNTVSAKLIKKLGFTYTHDEFYPPTGLNHPSYLMKRG